MIKTRLTIDLFEGTATLEEYVPEILVRKSSVIGKVEKNGFMVNGVVHEREYDMSGKWVVRQTRKATPEEMRTEIDEVMDILED